MTDVVKKAKKSPEHADKTAEVRYIKVTLVRSMIGYPRAQKETAKGLGLRKPQSSAVLKETPAVKGMVRKIVHVLKVETVEKP